MFGGITDVTQNEKIPILTKTTANFSESVWNFYLKLAVMLLHISKKKTTC